MLQRQRELQVNEASTFFQVPNREDLHHENYISTRSYREEKPRLDPPVAHLGQSITRPCLMLCARLLTTQLRRREEGLELALKAGDLSIVRPSAGYMYSGQKNKVTPTIVWTYQSRAG